MHQNFDSALTERYRRIDTFFLWIQIGHIPATFLISLGYGCTTLVTTLASLLSVVSFLFYKLFRGSLFLRLWNGACLMLFSALFIQAQFGRIEMHFHVFSALAILFVYEDWRVLLVAAVTIALHHLIGNYLQEWNTVIFDTKFIVYSYGTGLEIVITHALFVIFETGILLFFSVRSSRDFKHRFDTQFHLEEILEGVTSAVKEVSSGTEEFTVNSQKVTNNLEEFQISFMTQSSSIEEISAATEETAASSQMILDGANRQLGEVKVVEEINKELFRMNEGFVTSLETMRSQIQTSANNVKKTESEFGGLYKSMEEAVDDSEKMAEILDLITGIAEKVNLLSLNASIEAARAGDAGRGFAVVASEISKLADSTAIATKNISQISTKIEQTIRSSFQKSNQINQTVQSFVSSIMASEKSMKDLTDQITGTLSAFQKQDNALLSLEEIAKEMQISSKEQSFSMNEISKSVIDLNLRTQNNMHTSTDIVSLTKRGSVIFERLRQAVHSLAEKIK
ncbi:methyl-accepting chemotaxis protein [Leptospira sp. 96542]|nr:methyl-accepting chemotaxis protein [Leptospira sp. 96542]